MCWSSRSFRWLRVAQGLVQEDNTIEEMDEKEAVFVEQYRSGGIDMNDLQAIMVSVYIGAP